MEGIENVTHSEYRKLPGINWSALKSIGVSPLQFQFDQVNQREETSYIRVGLATHCHVLEPDAYRDRFTCFAETRRGKAWDLVRAAADQQGLTVLSEKESAQAVGAAAAVLANPYAAALLTGGRREHFITWTDADTGLVCKGRVDQVGARLVELKTAARMDLRTFQAQAARLGYHAQLAFYLDGLGAAYIAPPDDPAIIAVQSTMPHDVVVYLMPPDVIEAGREEYKRLLARLKECQTRKVWPGVAPDGPVRFALPAWYGVDQGDLDLTVGGEAIDSW